MKIIVVGGTGTIGKAVVAELKQRHEIVVVGKSSGDFNVDIDSEDSIIAMYKAIGEFDALVSASGQVHFGELAEMTETEYQIGLHTKLMGQVRLVLHGRNTINPDGSFTLTSGVLNREPIKLGASAAMVNGALEGFVKSAAIEMPHKIRLNIVSPTVIEEAMDSYAPYFRGFQPVSAARAALAYSRSVEGLETGQCYIVG